MDAAGGPAEPLGKVLGFMRLIWALDHGLQSLSKRMHASIGLTGPQRITLRVIGREPGISAGTLAAILRLHPSTLTGILQRLEERGLVFRTRGPDDRRRTYLALTSRGRHLDVQTPGTVEAVIERVLAHVPAARLRPAAEVLATVGAALLAESTRNRGRRPKRNLKSRRATALRTG